MIFCCQSLFLWLLSGMLPLLPWRRRRRRGRRRRRRRARRRSRKRREIGEKEEQEEKEKDRSGGKGLWGRRGLEVSIAHKLGERMMVRRLKISPCEREEQSVSKYVRRTGRACVCVWGSRGERSSTVAEDSTRVLKVKELRTTTGDLLSSRTLPNNSLMSWSIMNFDGLWWTFVVVVRMLGAACGVYAGEEVLAGEVVLCCGDEVVGL